MVVCGCFIAQEACGGTRHRRRWNSGIRPTHRHNRQGRCFCPVFVRFNCLLKLKSRYADFLELARKSRACCDEKSSRDHHIKIIYIYILSILVTNDGEGYAIARIYKIVCVRMHDISSCGRISVKFWPVRAGSGVVRIDPLNGRMSYKATTPGSVCPLR